MRHAKFPKTSYKVQLLDTRLHAACVSLNHRRRRGLIFLSSKVLAPFKQNASVLSGEGNPSHSLFCYIALRHLRTPPERPAAFRRLSLLSFRRGSQAKPAAQSAGKTLREEKATDFCLSLWRTIRDRKERSDGIAKRREASARRGSQAKPAAQSAGKTLREEKATDFCLSLWRTIRDSNPWPFGP